MRMEHWLGATCAKYTLNSSSGLDNSPYSIGTRTRSSFSSYRPLVSVLQWNVMPVDRDRRFDEQRHRFAARRPGFVVRNHVTKYRLLGVHRHPLVFDRDLFVGIKVAGRGGR